MIRNKNFRRSKNGFTLIELMIVIVIIGILSGVGLANFLAAQDRAKIANIKVNMHVIQHVAEMYSIDWTGIYPETSIQLKEEAYPRGYWRDMKNPFTGFVDSGTSQITSVTDDGIIDPPTFPAGSVAYLKSLTGYNIYGGEKLNGKAIMNEGKPFFLTNS